MGTPTVTKGHKPIIEYRRYVGRHFVVFPDLGVELSMAPAEYEVARYLAYHAWLGTPFHTRIPCYPRNTPYPRPNISYPREAILGIPVVEVEGVGAIEVAIPQQKEEAAMATTVTVKARAWGALVTITKKTEGAEGHNIENQDFEIPGNTTRDFTIGEGEKIEVQMGNAPPPGGQDTEEKPADPFDHDGDGKPGGSPKGGLKKKPDHDDDID
jgi:hypothetical protein